jgi:hypothetical protein
VPLAGQSASGASQSLIADPPLWMARPLF